MSTTEAATRPIRSLIRPGSTGCAGQAFSHLSLISATINLDYQLDHGAGLAERPRSAR